MIEPEDLIFDEHLDDPMTWSVSALKTISSCGKQFWWRYRTDVNGIQTPYLQFGKAVHKVIEEIHTQNNFSTDFWERLWSQIWREYAAEVEEWGGLKKLTFNNMGSKMLSKYVEKNVGANVLESEAKFPNGDEVYKIGPFTIRGVIDQVRRSDGGRLLVIDFKTSKYPPDPLVLRADPQFTMYYYVVKQKYGEDPLLCLYHLESGKMLYTQRTDRDVEMVEAMLKEGQLKVDQEMFERNIGYSCRNCPFVTVCLGDTHESSYSRGLEAL